MKAVFRKEVGQFLFTMPAYIFLAMFFALAGLSFYTSNLVTQNGDVKVYFSSLSSQMIFLIPLLTMRMFSEEKKLHTDQLLFTLPLKESEIVLGKFFAATGLYLAGLILTTGYPVILGFLGEAQGLVTLGNSVGLFLSGCTFIAMGILISSLAENQIVAAIFCYSLFALQWAFGYLANVIYTPWIQMILRASSVSYYFRPFALGIFDVGTIAVYLLTTAVCLVLTVYLLKYKRLCR